MKTIANTNIIKNDSENDKSRFFVLHLGNKKSRKTRPANGVPQGSVLVPMLFSIYMVDIPLKELQNNIYADDIAITARGSDFKTIASTLSTDLAKLWLTISRIGNSNSIHLKLSQAVFIWLIAQQNINSIPPSKIRQYLSLLYQNTLE